MLDQQANGCDGPTTQHRRDPMTPSSQSLSNAPDHICLIDPEDNTDLMLWARIREVDVGNLRRAVGKVGNDPEWVRLEIQCHPDN